MQDTTNYQQAIADIYDPQEKFIQEQISGLGAQYEPQKASIEQAKVNAFRDIQKEAFKRGRFFGGFQPAEQARYLGEKYLPGLQQLSLAEQNAKQGLLGRLYDIQSKKGSDILSYLEKRRQEAIAQQNQQALFAQQEKLARMNAPSNYQPTLSEAIKLGFYGYNKNDVKWQGTAEKMIPNLVQDYRISIPEAERLVYSYRKQQFGE